MTHDVQQMENAVARLSADQRQLVARCLDAVVHGPYIDDDGEFHAVMGVTREQAAQTLAAWPNAAAHGSSFVVVNNAMNNLLGYPHGHRHELERQLEAAEPDVAQALMAWRDEERREAGGKGYFDALL